MRKRLRKKLRRKALRNYRLEEVPWFGAAIYDEQYVPSRSLFSTAPPADPTAPNKPSDHAELTMAMFEAACSNLKEQVHTGSSGEAIRVLSNTIGRQ